jgi:hypothetical protein
VKLRLARHFYSLGLRLTEIDHLPTTPLQGRWLKYTRATSGWHFLWPLWWHTLSLRQVVFLVSAYRQKPAERPKIGSEAGLADVRAALAFIGSGRTTAKTPAGARS